MTKKIKFLFSFLSLILFFFFCSSIVWAEDGFPLGPLTGLNGALGGTGSDVGNVLDPVIDEDGGPESSDSIIKIGHTLFLKFGEESKVVNNIIALALKISLVLAPLLIILGGAMYFKANGEQKKIQDAKRLILWTIIGLAVLLFARFIFALLNYLLGV